MELNNSTEFDHTLIAAKALSTACFLYTLQQSCLGVTGARSSIYTPENLLHKGKNHSWSLLGMPEKHVALYGMTSG